MKKAIWVLMVLALAGCGEKAGTAAVSSEPAAAEVVQPVKAEHYYSMKDGFEYGYEKALSQNDIESGKASSELLFFKYAGERNGIYQAYLKDGQIITTLECANPCEFLKVMVFADGEFYSKERMRATEGVLGWHVMADAINGYMEQYIAKKDGKQFNIWFSEESGLERVPLKQPTT